MWCRHRYIPDAPDLTRLMYSTIAITESWGSLCECSAFPRRRKKHALTKVGVYTSRLVVDDDVQKEIMLATNVCVGQ